MPSPTEQFEQDVNPGGGTSSTTSENSVSYPYTKNDTNNLQRNLLDSYFNIAYCSRSNTTLKTTCLSYPTVASSYVVWGNSFRISNSDQITASGFGDAAFLVSPSTNTLPGWGKKVDVLDGAFTYRGSPINFSTPECCPIPYPRTQGSIQTLDFSFPFAAKAVFSVDHPYVYIAKRNDILYYTEQETDEIPAFSTDAWTELHINDNTEFDSFFVMLQGAGGGNTYGGGGGGGTAFAYINKDLIANWSPLDSIPVQYIRIKIGKGGSCMSGSSLATATDGEATELTISQYGGYRLVAAGGAHGGTATSGQWGRIFAGGAGGNYRQDYTSSIPAASSFKLISGFIGGDGGTGQQDSGNSCTDGKNIKVSTTTEATSSTLIDLNILRSGPNALRRAGSYAFGYGGTKGHPNTYDYYGGSGGSLCGYVAFNSISFGYGAGGCYCDGQDGCFAILACKSIAETE